jgi:hypothetical protein
MDAPWYVSIEDRRPTVRLTVNLDALYGATGTPTQTQARITNISSTGLRLRTDRTLVLGTAVDVIFVVPDAAPRSRIKLNVGGRVVRVVYAEEPLFEYAIEILSDDHRELMRRAVLKIDLAMAQQERNAHQRRRPHHSV